MAPRGATRHPRWARMSDVTQPETSAREREQSKLRTDLEVVRRYGESHSGDVVDVLYENEQSVRLVVLVAGGDVEAHDAALHRLVQFPDQLEVRHTPFTKGYLEEIREAVTEMARRRPGAFMSWGIRGGVVAAQLGADQEALAHQLHDRFAEALSLRVGLFAYPLSSGGDDPERPTETRSRLPILSPNEFAVELDGDITVASGRTVRAALRLHNRGGGDVVINTNGSLTAWVIDPATGEIVGGFVGAQTVPLVRYRVSPGETVSIPLLVGTASTARRLGYALPSGRWAMEVPVTIEGRGTFRTLPLGLVVVESATFNQLRPH